MLLLLDRSRLAVPPVFQGLSYGSAVAKPPPVQRLGFTPRVRKIPWKRNWQPDPVFLPGRIPRTEEPDGLQSKGS